VSGARHIEILPNNGSNNLGRVMRWRYAMAFVSTANIHKTIDSID
jgi:hypothetical protein